MASLRNAANAAAEAAAGGIRRLWPQNPTCYCPAEEIFVERAPMTDKTMEKGVPIRSVSRTLSVLQAINLAGSLSLKDIARESGLPYATVSRLVLTLLHEGMIEKEPDRKSYRPTVLVQSLASGYQDHSRLGEVCRTHIVALTAKHGWPLAVSTRAGTNMVIRDCTHTLSPRTLATYYPGFSYPLMESAAGLVYLAFCDPLERKSIIAELDQTGIDQRIWSNLTSESALDNIYSLGFATRSRNRFAKPEGKNSAIAVPIFSHGRICGTLALIFLASAVRIDKAIDLYAADTMETAKAIGEDLDEIEAP